MLTKGDELVVYELMGFIYDSKKKLLFLARRFMGIWLHGKWRRKCILRRERGQRKSTPSIRIRKMKLVNRPWYIEDQADKRKVQQPQVFIAETRKPNKMKEVLQRSQTVKHDSLGIPRSTILINILPPEPLLHDHPPRLIKPTPSALHNSLYSLLSLLIQALSAVSTLDILTQVKVCTAESSFDVVFETALA
jgi:hypothetical protein